MSGAPDPTEEDVIIDQVEAGIARFIENILLPHWDEEKQAWKPWFDDEGKQHEGPPTPDWFRSRIDKLKHALAVDMKAAPQLEQRWIKEAQAKKARI